MTEPHTSWVVLGAYSNNLEAGLVCSFLEAHNIATKLKDEHIVAIAWQYSNLVGGVKVQVPRDQFIEAKELLESREKDLSQLGHPCPNCQSELTRVYTNLELGLIETITSIATGIVKPLYDKKPWRCHSCSHQWVERSKNSIFEVVINWVFCMGLIIWGYCYVFYF